MKLNLSDDLKLPLAAVTEKLAFLGRTGSGKSYAAQKLAEEMHAAGAQFIALDPVGIWYSLRLAADGKRPGLPIPVLGGLRGDIPLEPTGGALIANLVVDRGTSVVLDVSQFESDAAKARFAQDFADRFFFRKKAAPSAVHLFIEECQEFVPQNPQREEARMLHAFTRLMKIGRNFGIGGSLISQRPQEVNKKVLNLAEVLFAFQLTGPQERKTVDGWIADKGIDEDIAAILPKLAVGHPHVWSPAWLKISRVIAIGQKTTFDASSTPVVGRASAARELSPIDLEALRKEMAATIEKAKAEDPVLLRRRIVELETQLRSAPKTATTSKGEMKAAAELSAFKQSYWKMSTQVTETRRFLRTVADTYLTLSDRFGKMREQAFALADDLDEAQKIVPVEEQRQPAPNLPPRIPRTFVNPDPRSPGVVLPKGERLVLIAIAQHDDGVTREQITILTGYKRSTRDAYIQRLGERKYIDQSGERIGATDDGVTALGSDYRPLPTGDALREHWLAKLPEGERRVLEVAIQAYPKDVDRDKISDLTEYKRSTRDAYIQRLGTRRLLSDAGRGQVRASDTLFG